ncbi:MAG TPA: hypothetical protein VMY41_00985 [Thermohalobaculum sp.]|nr:hypothetical protein [Thermohalobaculum sp.]
MTQAVIEVGDKLHIITRRNFIEDLRRHFAGSVLAVSGGLVRVQGYAFVFKDKASGYRRKPEFRTRIFGVADAQLIIIALPSGVAIDSLKYQMDSYSGSLEHFDQMLNLLGFPLAWFCDSSFSGGSADAHAAFARHSPSLSSLH